MIPIATSKEIINSSAENESSKNRTSGMFGERASDVEAVMEKQEEELKKDNQVTWDRFGRAFSRLKRLEASLRSKHQEEERVASNRILTDLEKLDKQVDSGNQFRLRQEKEMRLIENATRELEMAFNSMAVQESPVKLYTAETTSARGGNNGGRESVTNSLLFRLNYLTTYAKEIDKFLNLVLNLSLPSDQLTPHLTELSLDVALMANKTSAATVELEQLDITGLGVDDDVLDSGYGLSGQLTSLEGSILSRRDEILKSVNGTGIVSGLLVVSKVIDPLRKVVERLSRFSKRPPTTVTSPWATVALGTAKVRKDMTSGTVYVDRLNGSVRLSMAPWDLATGIAELELPLASFVTSLHNMTKIGTGSRRYIVSSRGRSNFSATLLGGSMSLAAYETFGMDVELAKAVIDTVYGFVMSGGKNGTAVVASGKSGSDDDGRFRWTQWSVWTACSVSCGVGGYQSRARVCVSLDGNNCQGVRREERICTSPYSCDLFVPVICPDLRVDNNFTKVRYWRNQVYSGWRSTSKGK